MISCWLLQFRDFWPWVFMVCPKKFLLQTNCRSTNQWSFEQDVLWCSLQPFAPHIHAVHFRDQNESTELSRISSATTEHLIHLDTGGHFLDFTGNTSASDFHHCTSHQTTTASYTCENISPEGQTLILLSWNCKASWQTPDHATFSTHHLLQKWHCQRRHWRIWGCRCK